MVPAYLRNLSERGSQPATAATHPPVSEITYR